VEGEMSEIFKKRLILAQGAIAVVGLMLFGSAVADKKSTEGNFYITDDWAKPGAKPDEGTAVYSLLIGSDGSIKAAKLVKSSGSKRLDEAAVQYAFTWRLKPREKDGVPIDMWQSFAITFKLDADSKDSLPASDDSKSEGVHIQ
jgi:TonB family protein